MVSMKKVSNTDPIDTGRKLNVHKTSSECLMYIQFMSCVYWGGGGWFKKSVAYKKMCRSSLVKFSAFPFHAFLRDKYISRSFAITFEKISHKKVLLYDSCLVELQTFSMNLWTKTSSWQRLMTVTVCRNWGSGHWCSLFYETVRNTS